MNKFEKYLNDLKKYGECIIDRSERNAFFDFCVNKIDLSDYAMELTEDNKLLIYLI